MALLRYDEALHGSLFERDDPVSRREDEQLWESWAKLRARWSNEVSAALAGLAVPSMIIGGVAVIAAGVARQTIVGSQVAMLASGE